MCVCVCVVYLVHAALGYSEPVKMLFGHQRLMKGGDEEEVPAVIQRLDPSLLQREGERERERERERRVCAYMMNILQHTVRWREAAHYIVCLITNSNPK